MKTKWLFIAVLSPLISFSQGDRSKGRVATIAAVGLAAGESTAKPLFQLSSGLVYGRWFTGIGVGLDQYNFNSVPLFADGRMNFGKMRSAFIYANGGYNLATKNKGLSDNWYKTTDRFYGGFYMDAGIGYRIRLRSLHRLLFSAGYSEKHFGNKVGYTYPCLVPPCDEDVYTYHYNFGRIVTKLSWEFGKTK